MAGAYKRKKDKARGKQGKYTIWYFDENGKRIYGTGTTDLATSRDMANRLESEATLVRQGMIDPGEKKRREANGKPLADHIEDYRLELLAKGGTEKHAKHVKGVLVRLLDKAAIAAVNDLACDRIQGALGRLKVANSARTANHAMGAIKAFSTWLENAGRIKEAPKGMKLIKPFNEKTDRKRVRRALTMAELNKLLADTEGAPSIYIYGPTKSKHSKTEVSGPARAALYRLAMGTGFRANELRSLTPESFKLAGNEPTVTIDAKWSKNGKEAIQPITPELAVDLKRYVDTASPGKPVLVVPDRTAQMLRADLERSGIPYVDASKRVVDFHALRGTYITHLIQNGANPKVVQVLARHSSITLTMDIYCQAEDKDLRGAINKGRGKGD